MVTNSKTSPMLLARLREIHLSQIHMRKKYMRVNILRCVNILLCVNQLVSNLDFVRVGFITMRMFVCK